MDGGPLRETGAAFVFQAPSAVVLGSAALLALRRGNQPYNASFRIGGALEAGFAGGGVLGGAAAERAVTGESPSIGSLLLDSGIALLGLAEPEIGGAVASISDFAHAYNACFNPGP
jgi:hypothetical protein